MLEEDEHEMKQSHTAGVGEGGGNCFCRTLTLRLQEVGSGQDISFLIGIFGLL